MLSQVLSETLQPSTSYTLCLNMEYAAVCWDYALGLYADGMLLGEVTQDDFALSNDFIDVMLTIDSRDFPSLLG